MEIKERRNELELSQEQLAFTAGVTPAYLGQVERGERNPTIGFMGKISDALNLPIGCFFESDDLRTLGTSEQHLLAELNEEQKQEIVRITEMILNAIK